LLAPLAAFDELRIMGIGILKRFLTRYIPTPGLSTDADAVPAHKFHHFEGFTDKYDVTRLLYWESYDDVHKALGRETQLTGWSRAKKIGLIVRKNPRWIDLAAEWYPWMEPERGRDASTPQ